jgi:hypothetical protein
VSESDGTLIIALQHARFDGCVVAIRSSISHRIVTAGIGM